MHLCITAAIKHINILPKEVLFYYVHATLQKSREFKCIKHNTFSGCIYKKAALFGKQYLRKRQN